MPHAQQLYMRYAERDFTADQPGGFLAVRMRAVFQLELINSTVKSVEH